MTTTACERRTEGKAGCPSDSWKPETGDGVREAGLAALYAVLFSLPILGLGGWLVHRDYAHAQSIRAAFREQLQAHDRLVAAAPRETLAVDRAVHGRTLFEASCAACHKADGTGVDGLGKNLTMSWFVASRDDAELAAFISRGRPPADPLNTTRVPMPPKGGHDELTDTDLSDIVTFVRGLQDPRRMPALPAPVAVAAAAPTEAQKAEALAAAGGDAELAGFIAHGTTIFASTCSACHGKDAKGLPNLGKDLVHSTFCKSLDDDALLAFVKRGRDPSDPANTTKVGMPPKGGNPALSDDDLLDVIAYVRSLQKQVSEAK
jgi:disulfide bond formation protein DsbB